MDLAALHFEGDASDWLESFFTEHLVHTWLELVAGVKEAFGLSKFVNPNELLTFIHQTGTVAEYRLDFTRKATLVRIWPEYVKVGAALSGLKEEFK